MNKSVWNRKLENVALKLNNTQKGVAWLPYYKYQDKLSLYLKTMKLPSTTEISSNIRITNDLALVSLCIDRIIEEYLHSKIYHFDNIGVLPSPFKLAPKTAILLIYSKTPTTISYEVKRNSTDTVVYKDTSSIKKYHRLSVTALDNGKNKIHLKMYNENGELIKERTIHIWLKKTNMSEHPITRTENYAPSAYSKILISGGGPNPCIFDSNGNIFHFIKMRTSSYGIFPLSNGRFLLPYRHTGVPTYANPHTCLLYEMDFMGRIYRSYHVKNGLHHFACELPNGNIVSISNSIQNHTEDVIVELERTTGKIVRKIHVKELLGTHLMDQIDWAHPNSLEYNQEEDSMLICFRNVHSILKFNWTTLEIYWLLSPPELWKETPLKKKLLTPLGDIHYSYQAHAAHEIKEFQQSNCSYRFYIVFDNHRMNRRPLPNHNEDGHSYINIYGINEKTNEIKQIKHLKIDVSLVRSNAIYDSDSNRIFNMSGCMARELDIDYRGKIEEYDYDSHRLLNCWYIKRDFFSAYPFTWHSDDYCKPISSAETFQYNCGEGDMLCPMDTPLPPEQDSIAEETWFSLPYIEENYLYFYTTDHSISAIIFQGRKGNYTRDYSDTWQTYEIHKNRKYYCVVSLATIPPDMYYIKIVKDNKLYSTGNYIQITKNNLHISK